MTQEWDAPGLDPEDKAEIADRFLAKRMLGYQIRAVAMALALLTMIILPVVICMFHPEYWLDIHTIFPIIVGSLTLWLCWVGYRSDTDHIREHFNGS